MTRRSVPALALALALTACGDDATSGSPADAVRDYNAAIAEGDGERACDRLDETAQEELQESAQGSIRGSCAKVVETLAGFYDEATKEALRKVNVQAEAQGDRATATFISPGALGGRQREQSYELRRVDGDWKIASLGITPDVVVTP
jgi:Domain of unknown function (DUF4878)